MRGERPSVTQKEGLIEDDEKLNTGNQLGKWRGEGRQKEGLGRIQRQEGGGKG